MYYEGVLCVKGKDYIEVGTAGAESTTIQLKDWQGDIGETFEFVRRG